MQVLETLDSEAILSDRMTEFAELWSSYDPPAGAQYDVDGLEFDPIKIAQEASTYFETLIRDRINQAAKAVTLAYGSGTDLDAIASRYPGGVPRLSSTETDDHYRIRIWLSSNTLSPHGTYEAYVFWAMTAAPTLRDATAIAAKRGTPNITVTIMEDGDAVTATDNAVSAFPSPTPTLTEVDAVRDYINHDSRKGLTDVVTVRGPTLVKTDYKIKYWLFPGWDSAAIEAQLYTATAALIEKQRWLGYSHTRAAIDAALMVGGVYNIEIQSPAADIVVDPSEVVVVETVELVYAGRGGFEAAEEP